MNMASGHGVAKKAGGTSGGALGVVVMDSTLV